MPNLCRNLDKFGNYFKNLKCDVIKEKTRGNPVKEYVFTFERDTSLPYQGQAEPKKTKKKGNDPNWSDPNYKNTTSPETQAEMAFQKAILLEKIDDKG